jgi:hypothetical protein
MSVVFKMTMDLIQAYSRDIVLNPDMKLGDIENGWIIREINIRLGLAWTTRLERGDMYILSKEIFEKNKKLFKSYGITKYHHVDSVEDCVKAEYVGE